MKLLTECMTFEYDSNLIKEQAQTEDGRFLMKGVLQKVVFYVGQQVKHLFSMP